MKLRFQLFPFLALLWCFSIRADQFGDVSVTANAIYTGATYHGYAERRVILENHSHGKTHVVTLVYPNNADVRYGNNIKRLSRTVMLGPDAHEIVSLLQPPLPTPGDGSIRVEVDNWHEGEIRAPNANNHCNDYRGSDPGSAVFISRSLDYDAIDRVFRAERTAFTAQMAVGPPDAGAGGGWQPNSWMPDSRYHGQTNWLELDYPTPQTANKIVIYSTLSLPRSGSITLIGNSPTNIAIIPLASGMLGSGGGGYGTKAFSGHDWMTEFSFPTGAEPVKTLRLDFGNAPPSSISVDAVEFFGPLGGEWACAARASSDNSASASSYGMGGSYAGSAECVRAESPVTEWSENWLAYSPFDCLVLSAADMNSISPAVLNAVGDYLSAGGTLVLSGKTELPAAWNPALNKRLSDGAIYQVGFGRCFTFDAVNLFPLDPASIQTLRATVRASASYWKALPDDSRNANSVLPIVENLKIPTRGIVLIMLAFIIAIGPVNIIYLNRRKRRTWMLWTIPAIAVATTLVVFVYSLLREGITPDTRIAGLTVIEQASHHAATIGGTAFYCPLTPSGGLHFDFETEATPLVQNRGYSGSSRVTDWTQFQHFQRGWVSARVPAYFHLRKSETRRERIQIVHDNGKLQIINGFGAPIRSFLLADADMNMYQAGKVAAGEKAALVWSKQSQTSKKSGPDGLLREIGFSADSNALQNDAERFLLPNTYIAVLAGNPFIENALGSVSSPKRTKSSAIVFGILESPAK